SAILPAMPSVRLRRPLVGTALRAVRCPALRSPWTARRAIPTWSKSVGTALRAVRSPWTARSAVPTIAALVSLAAGRPALAAQDRAAFRGWFTLLADAQFYRPTADVVDCAALVRHAAREALREHTREWLRRFD